MAKTKKAAATPEEPKAPKEPKKVTIFDVNEHAVQVSEEDVERFVKMGYRKEIKK